MKGFVLCLCFFAVATVNALYQDEVGQKDWTLRQFGKIESIVASASSSSWLLASPAQGVVARLAVDAATGEADWKESWRHVHEGSSVQASGVSEKVAFILSGDVLDVYEGAAGQAVGSSSTRGIRNAAAQDAAAGAGNVPVSARFVDNDRVILVCYGGRCGMFDALTGKETGKLTTTSSESSAAAMQVLASSEKLSVSSSKSHAVVIAVNDKTVAWVRYDLVSGALSTGIFTLPFAAASATLSKDLSEAFIWSSDGSHSTILGFASSKSNQVALKDVSAVVSNGDSGFAVLRTTGDVSLVAASGKIEAEAKLGAEGSRCVLSLGSNSKLLRGCTQAGSSNSVKLDWIDAKSGSLALRHQVTFAECGVSASDAVASILTADSEVSVLRFDSWTTVAIDSTGKVIWRREEGLSAVQSTLFVDLPAASVVNKLASNVRESTLVRDSQGHDHVLVMVSESGAVFGIHSTTSKTLWNQQFSGCGASSLSVDQSNRQSSFVLRSAAHFPPEVAVLLSCQGASQSRLVVLNPLTGEISHDEVLTFDVQMAQVLPQRHGAEGTHPLLMAGTSHTDNKLVSYLFPRRSAVVEVFEANAPLFVFIAAPWNGVMSLNGFVAFNLTDRATQEVALDLQWSIPVIGDVVAIEANPKARRAHAAGRAVRGGGVWARYLNSNMVAVASVDASGDSPSLHIMLVDAVSGYSIHHVVHENAQQPIHLSISENLVVYTYWSREHVRTEIASLEAFEGPRLSLQADLDWARAKRLHARTKGKEPMHPPLDWHSTEISSFDSDFHGAVRVFGHSWVAPATEVVALQLTQSAYGLTKMQAMIGLPSGHILAVDRAVLDPRRPPKELFTPEMHTEEGLFPDVPAILPVTRHMPNYYRVIPRLRAIAVEPTDMESTSIMLATGLDVFVTQIQPSGGFDALAPSFNYAMLSLTVVVLLVALVWGSSMSSSRDLRLRWN